MTGITRGVDSIAIDVITIGIRVTKRVSRSRVPIAPSNVIIRTNASGVITVTEAH